MSLTFNKSQIDAVPGVGNEWELDDGRIIDLLTVPELKALPDGTVVINIFGKEYIQSKDKPLDTDTRFGFTAFGFPRK